MQTPLHLPRLLLRSRIVILLLFCVLLWAFLPRHSVVFLLVRWHFKGAVDALTANDAWLFERPLFPVNIHDVGFIVKTGYSTRGRLFARLDAFLRTSTPAQECVVLVGDYSAAPEASSDHNGLKLPVHDVLAEMIESGALDSKFNATRLQYYSSLKGALARGEMGVAHSIGESHGWELDIMKHVSGLEYGYKLMPNKDWYILMDDDTYILNPSIKVVLGHLDPSVPHYIGNAVGDYKTRFAHGGSAVVFSRAAMDRIFNHNEADIVKAHLESLDSRFGDKLLAKAAMRSGIFLEEKYARYFNGERPRLTRIRGDRFCAPIISFHGLSPERMVDVGKMFSETTSAVSWVDLWKIYGAPTFESLVEDSYRKNWDYVGRLDEATMTTDDVRSKEDCREICEGHSSTCLAWTWETVTSACHISPWLIVGETSDDKNSGINAQRAIRLREECS